MNGLHAANDTANRGTEGLGALLMQRFGAEGSVNGGHAASLSMGGTSFRSMLKERMTNAATESDAGGGSREATETARKANVGHVAARSMNHGAAVSATRADSRRAAAGDAAKDCGGPARETPDDAGDSGTTRATSSEGGEETAQLDVRNEEGRLKIKVKSVDAGETLSSIVAAMLEAIHADSGDATAETAESADAAVSSADAVPAATGEATPATDAAALLKTLEGLLAQADAGTTGTTGAQDVDGFMEKLAALLKQAGVATDALKSLSIKFTTDDGTKLMLKLQSLAAGWKNTLSDVTQADPNAATTVDASLAADDAAGQTAVAATATQENTDAAGQNANPEGDGTDKTQTQNQERHTPTAFANAFPDAASQSEKTAQMAQGAGVHAVASGNRGEFGQRVSELAQAKQADIPRPLADPESAKSVTSQVLTRIQTVSGDEKHEMELQLKPESLGKINLRVIEEKGQILAKFTAESQQVKSILESNMQLLKDALEKNGLSVMQLSVSVGQQGAGQEGNGAAREHDAEGASRNGTGGIAGRLETRAALAAQGSGLSTRVREYLYGPDSTISLRA